MFTFACALCERYGLVYVERFGQVFESTALIGRDGTVEIGMCRHDDDRYLWPFRGKFIQQGETIHTGHPDIGDDAVRFACLQLLQHAVCIGKAGDVHACCFERFLQHPPDRIIVIDNPDVSSVSHVCSPAVSVW